ncbi:MAG: response regulator [Deltaproteobacteria bacterium]|jgi:DNA-binding NtrC family response regulator|nr:response regulator [Deltaproteobacteria bacterium]
MAKILVVDDEAGYRLNLGRVAAREGHQVEAAGDPDCALELARSFAPDVLIVDWMLSGGADGLDLASSLRGLNDELTVVLISGYPSAQLQTRADEVGVFELLSKPFDLSALQDTLRRATARA